MVSTVVRPVLAQLFYVTKQLARMSCCLPQIKVLLFGSRRIFWIGLSVSGISRVSVVTVVEGTVVLHSRLEATPR